MPNSMSISVQFRTNCFQLKKDRKISVLTGQSPMYPSPFWRHNIRVVLSHTSPPMDTVGMLPGSSHLSSPHQNLFLLHRLLLPSSTHYLNLLRSPHLLGTIYLPRAPELDTFLISLVNLRSKEANGSSRRAISILPMA